MSISSKSIDEGKEHERRLAQAYQDRKERAARNRTAAMLDEIEAEGREPSEWESQHLALAIGSTDDGLFDLAASNLNNVIVDEADISPKWQKQTGLCDLTVLKLRAALHRLIARPVQERPIFHRVFVS